MVRWGFVYGCNSRCGKKMIKDKLRSLYYKLKHFFYSYVFHIVEFLARYVISIIVLMSFGFMLEQSGVIVDDILSADELDRVIKFMGTVLHIWILVPLVRFNINLIEFIVDLFKKK